MKHRTSTCACVKTEHSMSTLMPFLHDFQEEEVEGVVENFIYLNDKPEL